MEWEENTTDQSAPGLQQISLSILGEIHQPNIPNAALGGHRSSIALPHGASSHINRHRL